MSCDESFVKLQDVCLKICSGGTPRTANKEFYVNGVIPWVKTKEVNNNKIFEAETYITEEALAKSSAKLIPANSVIIAMYGNGDTAGRVAINKIPVSTNQACCNLIVDPEKADYRFVFYYLRTQYQKLVDLKNGGAQQNLNATLLKEYLFPKVALQTQIKIADFLERLDDKIILNTQTNQTLEEMAQAIFKSWFVDFDPIKAKMRGEQPEGMDAPFLPKEVASLFPDKLVESELGMVPEGWDLSEIGDEVTVVGGGTPSKKNDDFWVDGDIHWTSPKDLSGVQDKVLLDTASKLTEVGLKKVSSGLLPVDTVLLSSRAPVGYLALAKVPLAINQGYIAMKCEKSLPPEFVLQWCVHRMDEIKQRASGSTFAEISKKNFKPISVVVPSEEELAAYQKLVKPLYDAITINVRQSEQLSSLRDTLLPKLLSGEIELGKADALAEVN